MPSEAGGFVVRVPPIRLWLVDDGRRPHEHGSRGRYADGRTIHEGRDHARHFAPGFRAPRVLDACLGAQNSRQTSNGRNRKCDCEGQGAGARSTWGEI